MVPRELHTAFRFALLYLLLILLMPLKVSSAPGSSEPEWSSEAVQIGGAGAAIGLLGMWTGALHERPDPLGKH